MKQIFKIILLFTFLSATNFGVAQSNNISVSSDTIRGKVIDTETKEGIPFATVILMQLNKKKTITVIETITDLDGNYTLYDLNEGIYDMKIDFLGYKPFLMKNIKIINRSSTLIFNIALVESRQIISCGGYCGDYIIPLFNPYDFGSGRIYDSREIEKSPVKW